MLRLWGFILSLVSPQVFRAMKQADDGYPEIGDSARTLGARFAHRFEKGVDILIGDDGRIRPKSGGISVAINSPENLPAHRRPKEFGGTGKDPVFRLRTPIRAALRIRVDEPEIFHANIEPLTTCTPDEFRAEVRRTRNRWRPVT